jgi:hypothetical protein
MPVCAFPVDPAAIASATHNAHSGSEQAIDDSQLTSRRSTAGTPGKTQPGEGENAKQRTERVSKKIVPSGGTTGQEGLMRFVQHAHQGREDKGQQQQGNAMQAQQSGRQPDQNRQQHAQRKVCQLVPRHWNKADSNWLRAKHKHTRHQNQQQHQRSNTQLLQSGGE